MGVGSLIRLVISATVCSVQQTAQNNNFHLGFKRLCIDFVFSRALGSFSRLNSDALQNPVMKLMFIVGA